MDLENVITEAVNDAADVPVADDPTPAGGGSDEAAAATTPDPLNDEPDAFAKEHGYRSKRPDGRENRIPHSRVVKISENQVRKSLAAVAKELGISKAEAELKLDDILGSIKERGGRFTELESRMKNIDAIEQIMANDPDRFLTMMAEANPAYKKFTERKEAAAATVASAEQKDENANDPMPEPDYELKDGQGNVTGRTYSKAGLDKLRAWDKRQTLREANAGFKKQLDERFKPLDEQQKREQERQKVAAIQKQAGERVEQMLARAAKWHGFKENEAEILKAIQADKTLDLYDAYMQVVPAKMAGDRTKMREEILAELKKAPTDTSTGGARAAAGGEKAGPRSMEDIIRSEWEKSKGKRA